MGTARSALGLSGEATKTLAGDSNPDPSYPDASIYGHFDDPASSDCRWTPGNMSPIDTQGAPEEPAVFWCRQHFVVSHIDISGT
jgi:hypothetical protein